MGIKRALITVAVMFDDEFTSEEEFRETSLERILTEMYDGQMVGYVGPPSINDVPSEEVRDRLLVMGNDGTFFDYKDGTSGQDRESYTDTQDRDNYT